MDNLVIVESPAKASTIEKILGKGFKVMSSYGHIRDLEKKNMGIDLRAEIISKKMSFLKKTDLFTRIRRLTHKDEMGELFKVMFVTTKDNNFKTGFNDIKI